MKTTRIGAFAVAALAILTLPVVTSAAVLLDTGTPSGTGAPLLLYPAQSLAAEFTAPALTNIGTVSAYLTAGTAQPGDMFTFYIYQSLPSSSNRSAQPLFSTTATWEQNGWTTATVNWTLPSTGNYWLALKSPTTGYQFDAPVLTSTSAGPTPALAFDVAGSNGYFSSTTSGFGVEINSVPEPTCAALVVVGLGLAAGRRRRRFI